MEKIVIIGAGLAGLACARTLRAGGFDPLVLDKGRGLGGRLATRRAEGGLQFDHGAQFVTARTDAFRQALHGAQKARQAGVWTSEEQELRYVGQPGMSGLAKHLAAGLRVRRSTHVTKTTRDKRGWRLETTDGPIDAQQVVSTMPAPQLRDLLGSEHLFFDALSEVRFDPCLALMVALNAPASERGPVMQSKGGALDWIARDGTKPGRGDAECWVAHASPDWSRQHLEVDKSQLPDLMLPLFLDRVQAPADQVSYAAGHRWRYARVAQPLGRAFAVNDDATLYAGGDWCLGPRAEAAWSSGTQIAQDILVNAGIKHVGTAP